jgi:hypothetical protein
MKGMALDSRGAARAFDARNLSAEVAVTGVWESHLVAMEMGEYNGKPVIDKVYHPTREEAEEWGETLLGVYHSNALEQSLRKAERRANGFYSALR